MALSWNSSVSSNVSCACAAQMTKIPPLCDRLMSAPAGAKVRPWTVTHLHSLEPGLCSQEELARSTQEQCLRGSVRIALHKAVRIDRAEILLIGDVRDVRL